MVAGWPLVQFELIINDLVTSSFWFITYVMGLMAIRNILVRGSTLVVRF